MAHVLPFYKKIKNKNSNPNVTYIYIKLFTTIRKTCLTVFYKFVHFIKTQLKKKKQQPRVTFLLKLQLYKNILKNCFLRKTLTANFKTELLE